METTPEQSPGLWPELTGAEEGSFVPAAGAGAASRMRDESQFALSSIRPDRGTRMQKTDPHPDVVVGLDFSSGDAAAIDAAAFEAARRHVPLVLLAAIDQANRPATILAETVCQLIAEAQRDLQATAENVADQHPTLDVRQRVAHGAPAEVLLDASAHGSLLVLCSRGMSGVGQFLSRSIAWRVAARALGPVLLVRPGAELPAEFRGGPVVVGVDGTERSSAAVEFGFREASLRGTSLAAVNVWGRPHPKGLNAGRDYSTERDNWLHEMNEDADRALSESLAGLGPAFPDVTVEHVVRHALTVPDTLLSVGRERRAAMVVVGAGGQHSLGELALGAVGMQLSHCADQPVAVVHSAWAASRTREQQSMNDGASHR